MSIITFMNNDQKESGQSLSVAAIATLMAIEHNYKILIISTDFNDKTLVECFFDSNKNGNLKNMFSKSLNSDIANGLEGLVRIFASNRADKSLIGNYTKPILKDRLDILEPPRTNDYKEYVNISTYFSQIAEVANSAYDIVFVDLSKKMPLENQKKILDLSTLVIVGLNQNQNSMKAFETLKLENEFFRRKNVLLFIGKYNMNSEYTAKNIGRYLKEKNTPLVVPYNILFADHCADSKILDYFLAIKEYKLGQGKEQFFCTQVRDTIERIDYLRQAEEFGLNY